MADEPENVSPRTRLLPTPTNSEDFTLTVRAYLVFALLVAFVIIILFWSYRAQLPELLVGVVVGGLIAILAAMLAVWNKRGS